MIRMKKLVVFYSRTGNTRKIGKEIAGILGSDADEITDLKDRSGMIGWIMAGRDATAKKPARIKYNNDPSRYDIVIIGTPVWAWTVTPAVREYLSRNRFKNVAFFCTAGSQIGKTFDEMEKLSKKPVAKFWVSDKAMDEKGSKDKIKGFCDKINSIKG